jgi:hypothetical protein
VANGHGGGGWCAVFVGNRQPIEPPRQRSRSTGVGLLPRSTPLKSPSKWYAIFIERGAA